MKDIVVGVKINKAGAVKGVKGINTELDKVSKSAKKAETSTGSFIGKMKSSKGAMLGWAAAITGAAFAFSKITKEARIFEKSMSAVRAIVNPTAAGFDQLTKKARELGRSTQFTATQTANAFVEMGKLGLKTNQIIAASADILNLAIASMSDITRASEVAIITMNQFGLEAGDVGKISDVMALSFSSSALDMEKFAESMKFAGTISKGLGVSFEETTGYLSALASGGLSGSIAGTGLSNMMQQLATESGKVGGVLEEFGLTGKTVQEKIKGLSEANIGAEKTFSAFGRIAGKAALTLFNNHEIAEKLTKSYLKADGAAKKMADTMKDNLSGAIIEMKSAWSDLNIEIGMAFSDANKSLVESFTGAFRSLGRSARDSKKDNQGFMFSLEQTFKVMGNTASIDIFEGALTLFGLALSTAGRGVLQFTQIMLISFQGLNLLLEGFNFSVALAAKGVSWLLGGAKKDAADAFLENSFDAMTLAIDNAALSTMEFEKQFLKTKKIIAGGGSLIDEPTGGSSSTKSTDDDNSSSDDDDSSSDEPGSALTKAVGIDAAARTALLEKSYSGQIILLTEKFKKEEMLLNASGVSTHNLEQKYMSDSESLAESHQEKLAAIKAAAEASGENHQAEKSAAEKKHSQDRIAYLSSFEQQRVSMRSDSLQKTLSLLEFAEAREVQAIVDANNQKLLSKEEYETQLMEIEQDFAVQREEAKEADAEEFKKAMIASAFVVGEQLMNIANSFQKRSADKDKKDLSEYEKREKSKIKGLNVTNKRKLQLEDKLDKEITAKKKEQFDKEKRYSIAMALINGALATIKVWASPGYPIAIPLTIAMIATTAASVTAIAAQQFAEGGIVRNTRGAGIDREPAMLTAGEIVSNSRQQDNLMRAMETGVNPLTNNTNNTTSSNQNINFNVVNNVGGEISAESMANLQEANDVSLNNLENRLEELKTYGRMPALA